MLQLPTNDNTSSRSSIPSSPLTSDTKLPTNSTFNNERNVGHIIDLENQFQSELSYWDQYLLQPCQTQLNLPPPTQQLLSNLISVIYKLRRNHYQLLQKLKAFSITTPINNPELLTTLKLALHSDMELNYKLYASNFFDGYQLLLKLQGELTIVTNQSLELFMYKPFEMIMTYKKLIQYYQSNTKELNNLLTKGQDTLEGLASLISPSKPDISNYEQIYQLQHQLLQPKFDLTDSYRKILLRSNFELMDMKWLANNQPIIPSSLPNRIHCILLSDTFLVLNQLKTTYKIIFYWDNIKDLSIIQLKPRAGDPFGTSMLLVIRKWVAFKVHAANPEIKSQWVQWTDQTKLDTSCYSMVGESMRDLMTPIDMSKSNSTPPITNNKRSEPLMRQHSEGTKNPKSLAIKIPQDKFDMKSSDIDPITKCSNIDPITKCSNIDPITKYSNPISPRNDSSQSKIMIRSSSTTLGSELSTMAGNGVCQFLSKPCHLLLHKKDSFNWVPYTISLEIRRYSNQPSYLLGWDPLKRSILKIPILLNQTKLRSINETDLELVYKSTEFKLTMSDSEESLELQSIFKQEEDQSLQESSIDATWELSNSYFNTSTQHFPPPYNSSPYLNSRSKFDSDLSTCLISVTCKLFSLRAIDQSWAKIGTSQLELYKPTHSPQLKCPQLKCPQLKCPQLKCPHPLPNSPLLSPTKKSPPYHLLIKSNPNPDAPTRIHFSPQTYRCEKLSPLKLLVVHLDSHRRTTTIMIQVKSKYLAQQIDSWLL